MMNGIDVVKITDDKSMFTTKNQLHVYDILMIWHVIYKYMNVTFTHIWKKHIFSTLISSLH